MLTEEVGPSRQKVQCHLIAEVRGQAAIVGATRGLTSRKADGTVPLLAG